ncbi:hypothetical protein GOV09_05755 [Candidatus Woesearchaeota archaeon]|nr:hypothetical protein [Candidatus Woesearchaeota archaeon]
MDENVSRKAVLVLVIIAVVVSIFSTTLVLNAVYDYQPPAQQDYGAPLGRVVLSVPGDPSGTGKVVLSVPEEEK